MRNVPPRAGWQEYNSDLRNSQERVSEIRHARLTPAPAAYPSPHPPPQGAGLSHMTEGGQEEGIVPACTFDFAADRGAVGVGPQDVECEPAQDSEVFGGVVLSSAVGVLGEVDVEHPMEPVLDT